VEIIEKISFNIFTNYAHTIRLVSTNLLTFPLLVLKKSSSELEFADQMAYSQFSPDWIVKES